MNERVFWPALCAVLAFHWILSSRHNSPVLVAYYGTQPGEPAHKILYAADVAQQKVRTIGNLGGFSFDDCMVLDARNWRCEIKVPSGWPIAAYVATDGEVTVTDKKNFVQPESMLKWESARLFGPLAKLWGAT